MTAKAKKVLKTVLLHTLIFSVLLAYILLTKGACIFRIITKVPCPTCGTTRAILSLFSFKISDAFYYNPVFFCTPLLIFLIAHRGTFLKRIPAPIFYIILGVVIALMLGVYIVRMIFFTIP